MVVRCTVKLLKLLGPQSLVKVPPSDDDWYANLIWIDRRKCLLVTHAGTLFPVFVADTRAGQLRPFERQIVELLTSAMLEEGLPSDALGPLQDVHLAKTASKHVLGVMNQMAFEIEWAVDSAVGLYDLDSREINHHLRRGLHTKDGDYRRPLDLVNERIRYRG